MHYSATVVSDSADHKHQKNICEVEMNSEITFLYFFLEKKVGLDDYNIQVIETDKDVLQ